MTQLQLTAHYCMLAHLALLQLLMCTLARELWTEDYDDGDETRISCNDLTVTELGSPEVGHACSLNSIA